MAYPDPRGSPRLPLLVAAVVATLVLACYRSEPTAPSARAAVPGAPSRVLDPGQDYTADPNDGCWIAPDSSVFRDSPRLYGGIYPYTFTRCGVSMNVWWPGFSNGVDWPLTAVFPGYPDYTFPWGHRPGSCCGSTGPGWGYPWTVTFEFGKAVRNVRVYTRLVDYPGGVVRVKGAFGNLIAEKPIPVSSTVPGARDTVAFADTNVYIIEIVADRDPTYPADALYPERRESIGWQAQFEPAPPQPCPPPNDSLLKDKAFRDSLGALLKDSNPNASPDTLRRERGAMYLEDKVTGERIFVRTSDPNATNCSVNNSPNHDYTRYVLLATIHTHPYFVGDFVRFCGSRLFNQTYIPGSSNPDYNGLILDNYNYRAVQNNRYVREYTVDKWAVNRTRIDGGISQETQFPHTKAGCEWWPQ